MIVFHEIIPKTNDDIEYKMIYMYIHICRFPKWAYPKTMGFNTSVMVIHDLDDLGYPKS